MAKFARAVITIAFTIVGTAIGGPIGASIGTFVGTMLGNVILPPSTGKPRAAAASSLQIGEVPRQAIIGRAATPGSLVDAFNYGGKYGTDWEVLVIALADHRCDALEGVYVNDNYVPFVSDGAVAGYNNQLSIFWRPGTETQSVPSILTANGPGWTVNDNGAGVSYAVVAYKADASDAKNPVWTNGRPRFQFVVRGALCYDPRLDSTVGGSGAQRWADPSTWTWSENPIVTRYKFARGFFACDRVNQPDQLLVGRGLSAVEAPEANLFHRANLCDELVSGEPRYRVGGLIEATETYIDVENDFAAACAGTIIQPEGSVEIDPGEAKAPVVTITDADLVVGSKVKRRWFLGIADRAWVNSVVASYIEPAQNWSAHTAPVRRDIADIQADGAPREEAIQLGFVTWSKQAGRIAEIVRRMGRLFLRAELVLPPRFCELEEGDWIVWQSDRYLNGQAYTFRIEAWGSDKAWQHSVVLRQISASCYSDTAPLDDGSVAIQQAARPAIGAPAAGNWSVFAGHLSAGGMRTPALIVSGASDDPSARFVRLEYVQSVDAPTAATIWSDAGVTGPDVKRREIAVAAGGIYWVAISYIVDGVQGDRLVKGPGTSLTLAYPDGTPVENLKPGEAGAQRATWNNVKASDPAAPADYATRNVNRGAWSSASVAYLVGDFVQREGSSYSVITAHTSSAGNGPPSAFWTLLAAVGNPGTAGAAGTSAITGYLTSEAVQLSAFANGEIVSYAPATGSFKIFSGNTDVSASFSLSTISNPQALTVSYSGRTYTVTAGFDASEDTASLTIRATGSGAYAAVTIDKVFSLAKAKTSYEIVSSLPTTNLFLGRAVFLTTNTKFYRYVTSPTAKWTSELPAADIAGQLVGDQIANGAIVQEKIAARAIVTSKMAVTDFENLAVNGSLVTGTFDGWTNIVANSGSIIGIGTDAANWPSQHGIYFRRHASDGGELSITNGNGFWGSSGYNDGIQMEPGDEITVEAVFWTSVPGCLIGFDCVAKAVGGSVFTITAEALENMFIGGTTQAWAIPGPVFTKAVCAFKNTTGARIRAFVRVHGPTIAGAEGYMWNLKNRRRNNAQLIVDGAITAKKLVATELFTNKAQINNLFIGTQKIEDLAITSSSSYFNDFNGGFRRTGYNQWYDIGTSGGSYAYIYVGYPNGDYEFDLEFGTYNYVGAGNGEYAYSYTAPSSAQVSVTTSPTAAAGSQKVYVEAMMVLARDANDDDNIDIQVIRNGTTALPEVYTNIQVFSGRRPYTFFFVDQSPTPNALNTYKLQVRNTPSDGAPYFYDVSLRATLYRK